VAVVTLRQLLTAGVHFGHQTRRWNPKMRRYILGERNGIYLIDLRRTLEGIESAYAFVRDLAAGGGNVLFVGTKKQAQGPVADYAAACGMPYVNQRWLGGMLTNFTTVSARVKRMQDLRAMQAAGDFEGMPKREALRHVRELEKLTRNLGGISGLDRLPDAIFVIDTKKEHIAVTEANKLRMPVVAVVDTNCDPDEIDYVIPGNDDAIRSANLMCRVVADAVAEGRWIASHRPATRRPETDGSPPPTAPSPPRPRPRASVDASHPEPPHGADETGRVPVGGEEGAASQGARTGRLTPDAAGAAPQGSELAADATAPASEVPEDGSPAPTDERAATSTTEA